MISKRNLLRISTFLLILMLLFSAVFVTPITANAADTTKEQKSYEIAVAFDNSYSMYIKNDIFDMSGKKVGETDGKAWCRAKYAMEIFASMLDYSNGDRLTIFPMWEVVTDGSQPIGISDNDPTDMSITIDSVDDISKISNMFTFCPLGTPFAPVDRAASFLEKSNKDEKWLLVLTDGAFNPTDKKGNLDYDATIDENTLSAMLSKKTNGNIKVQYLGFGSASVLSSAPSSGFYSANASDADLQDKLIDICNTIFKRDELPGKYISGNSVNLDLSMNKVLVFVQGEGATINSLKDSSGKSVPILLNSGQRKYSTISEGRLDPKEGPARVDNTLFGQVVTFDACPKGEYTLDYTGSADALQIFYEPNVDIEVTLTDSDGNVITKDSGQVYAGDYTIDSRIVDAITGEEVTNHELMGGNVSLKTYVETSKDSTPKEFENGDKITLDPDSDTTIYVEGKYLEDYTISTKGNPDFNWLSHMKVEEEPAKILLDAECLQDGSYYLFSKFEEWKPIKVTMLFEGQPLKEEQMASTEVTASCNKDIKLRCEKISGESAFYIYPAQDENGNFVEPEAGVYKINASATYTDELGVVNSGETEKPVKIELGSIYKWLKILLRILFWLLIVALIVAWLIHPVLPKRMYLAQGDDRRVVNISRTVTIKCRYDEAQTAISGKAKAIFEPRNFWINSILKPTKMSFKLVDVSVGPGIKFFALATEYGVQNGKLLNSNGKEQTFIKRLKNGAISWKETDYKGKIRTYEGTISINR